MAVVLTTMLIKDIMALAINVTETHTIDAVNLSLYQNGGRSL
jgi:hypothetical protein